jgi:phytanoyl-CoA hydroxylase
MPHNSAHSPAVSVEGRRLFAIEAPHGGAMEIADIEDIDALDAGTLSSFDHRARYDSDGYVLLRGLIPPELCDEARRAFAAEVKPYPGFIYRQATAVPEKNVFTEHGHVLNSLLNIQDLDRSCFPRFTDVGMRILTHQRLQAAVADVLGEPGTIVQTMYFDGNPSTWAHQDTYYLDSTQIGRMTAAWIAVEDIHPGAGRFFVYPGSHKIDMAKNGGDFDIAFNHDRYKKLVIDTILRFKLQCHAPPMRKGDVLLWAARTIHGSLQTKGTGSRSSFTAHFIPASTGLLQFQARARSMKLREVNGLQVHCPKDQTLRRNRTILYVETRFPRVFKTAKRLAIKALTR